MSESITLQVWKTKGFNPSEDPAVRICIGSVQRNNDVYPWVLPLEKAMEIFGQKKVNQIRYDPQEVKLSMKFV